MLVKELIVKLQKYSESLRVETEDEFGAIDIDEVVLTRYSDETVVTLMT